MDLRDDSGFTDERFVANAPSLLADLASMLDALVCRETRHNRCLELVACACRTRRFWIRAGDLLNSIESDRFLVFWTVLSVSSGSVYPRLLRLGLACGCGGD